ncbi:hypothetical protein [Pseudonocardia abyssalis]|uniref:Uncharacterized protein n=1 Tax=Pseudonocardia abyssalis TaxID=2792008 RepID=A0ABS6UXC8_9PSEU|nr:hypothetical protein [Pseudonocardia abyssalis]MBW0114937.1 hypothetical protein [Pseudonocardia abyssalis]MBW0136928.1 hypothetical protein [Pseudonocardia abyssalis]
MPGKDVLYTDTLHTKVFGDLIGVVLYDWLIVAGALRIGDVIRVADPFGIEIGRISTWDEVSSLVLTARGLPDTTKRITASTKPDPVTRLSAATAWIARDHGRYDATSEVA